MSFALIVWTEFLFLVVTPESPPLRVLSDLLLVITAGLLSFEVVARRLASNAATLPSYRLRFWEPVLACGILAGCLAARWVWWSGSDYTPELRRLRDTPSHNTSFQDPTSLPQSFRSHPELRAMLARAKTARRYDDLQMERVLPAWTETMRELVALGNFWQDPMTLQMARFGSYFVPIMKTHRVSPQTLEVVWLSALTNLDTPYFDNRIPLAVEACELSESEWERLITIGLRRTDLAQAAPLNVFTAEQPITDRIRAIESQLEHTCDEAEAVGARRKVNRTWKKVVSGDYSSARAALDRATVDRLSRVDPFEPEADPYPLIAELSINRADLVCALILMELKRNSASGRQLPQTASDLRPELRQLLTLYSSWITLEFQPKQVRVITTNHAYRVLAGG